MKMFLFGEILQPQRPRQLPEATGAFCAGFCTKGDIGRRSDCTRLLGIACYQTLNFVFGNMNIAVVGLYINSINA